MLFFQKTCYYNQIFGVWGDLVALMGHFDKKWAMLAMAWFGLMIYALLFHQSSPTPIPVSHLDKVAHLGLFFGQFWLLARAVFLDCAHKKTWCGFLLLALILAVATEFAQSLTATRQMDVYDGMADMLGAVLALGLASFAKQAGWFKKSIG